MGIFREIPPTAGFPLYFKDILSLFKSTRETLEDNFKQYLNVSYAKVVYSGTVAFYLILESLKKISAKKTVIIPAFICPLLPLAIKRAGLKVEVCDINQDNFNFNLAELKRICAENDDILAVVPTHLAGIPIELEPLEEIANKYKIFIIEDCAQSLGAEYKGKKVGTRGDFSFFSLCRGKGLTIYEGGVVVTNNKEYAVIIDEQIKRLVKNNYLSETLKIFELFGYWVFYRPGLFWFIFRLPQIFWNLQKNKSRANIEYFEIDFPIHAVSRMRKSVGQSELSRITEEISRQRDKVNSYIEVLRGKEGIRVIQEPAGAKANYPYLALIFSEAEKRKKAFELFENSGLGVSQIYALPITGYDYLKGIVPGRHCPNADFLAQNTLTLSMSIYLQIKDLASIIKIINKL